MGRRIEVTVRGVRVDVDYVEPAGTVFHPLWHFCGGEVIINLTAAEARIIDAACLHDLIERRAAWRVSLERRRRRIQDERVGEGTRAL